MHQMFVDMEWSGCLPVCMCVWVSEGGVGQMCTQWLSHQNVLTSLGCTKNRRASACSSKSFLPDSHAIHNLVSDGLQLCVTHQSTQTSIPLGGLNRSYFIARRFKNRHLCDMLRESATQWSPPPCGWDWGERPFSRATSRYEKNRSDNYIFYCYLSCINDYFFLFLVQLWWKCWCIDRNIRMQRKYLKMHNIHFPFYGSREMFWCFRILYRPCDAYNWGYLPLEGSMKALHTVLYVLQLKTGLIRTGLRWAVGSETVNLSRNWLAVTLHIHWGFTFLAATLKYSETSN